MSELIGPQSEFQERCLNSDAKIIILGGAAGSAKSTMGLMRHLRWIDDPKYAGFCLRKNSTAIMKEGGLFQAAIDIYKKVEPKLKVKLKDQKLVFPSGASVSFSHYENDKAADLYQGLEMAGTFYDEGAQASESHIWWLISRLRTKAKVSPSIWISCNPDPDSFLRGWVDWWLYPEGHELAGLPDPSKNGIRRYILRKGGILYWADTAEELIAIHGNPKLPMDHPKQARPLSIEVHLGTIYDNPWLIENQPDYLSSLEALPDVERRRLLHGDWNARAKGSTFFQRDWLEEILVMPDSVNIDTTVRTFDFAGTLKSDGNPSPDYTATMRMNKTKTKDYIIDDIRRTRIQFGDWKKFILDCALTDPPGTEYYIPVDPNPAAKAASNLLVRELAELGLYAKTIRASNSKLDRFRPFSAMAQAGGIKILKGCFTDYENNVQGNNETFYKELEGFTGERKRGESGHDDLVDVSSDAFSTLASSLSLPPLGGLLNINLSRTNSFLQ